jgi:hypothetical protein
MLGSGPRKSQEEIYARRCAFLASSRPARGVRRASCLDRNALGERESADLLVIGPCETGRVWRAASPRATPDQNFEDAGLDAAVERERYAAYQRRFGIQPE